MKGGFQDKFLLAGSLAGDEEQFGKIYDKYSQSIYRYIFFRISDHELAQDLTADTFLRTWQYVCGREKEIENLKSLLYRIAANLVIDHYRRRGREPVPLSELDWTQLPDKAAGPGEVVEKMEKMTIIEQALAQLPPPERELIHLRYVDGLSTGEIADLLSKSSGAIRVAMHRALRGLKNILKGKK